MQDCEKRTVAAIEKQHQTEIGSGTDTVFVLAGYAFDDLAHDYVGLDPQRGVFA